MHTRLLEEAGQLPVQDRIDLMEAIWNTIAEDADGEVFPVPEAHRAELNRRLATFQEHPDAGSLGRKSAGGLSVCGKLDEAAGPLSPRDTSAP